MTTRKPKPAKPPKPKEADILRGCLHLLTIHNIPHFRNNTGGTKIGERFVRFGTAGWPDIIAVLPGGRFLGVECKRPGAIQSDAQIEVQAKIQRVGGIYALIDDPAKLFAILGAPKVSQ